MKLMLRVAGTWLLGLTVILVVIDGAKTLGANALVTTSIADTWASMHAASWTTVSEWIIGGVAPIFGTGVTSHVFSWPGWLFAGILGVSFLVGGRRHMRKNYIQTH